MSEKRNPGARAGLTHELVLAAARDVITERGAAGLTMRAVAARLEVAPNALYSHVTNKTQLIDDLLDDLLADVDEPRSDATEPLAGITTMLTSTYRVLTAHADLVPLYLTRQGARGPNAVHLGEILDGLLTRAGVAASAVVQARRVLIIHAIGSAAFGIEAHRTTSSATTSTLLADYTTGLRWLLVGITE